MKLGPLREAANNFDSTGRATLYKAQVHSIMEYACLCWMNASSTNLSQLDNIQRNALKIICRWSYCPYPVFNSQSHPKSQIAAISVFYKMHTRHCPTYLYMLLPHPQERKRVIRSSESMPDHALTVPDARTNSLDRSFIHLIMWIWNNLPKAVWYISITRLNSFKGRAHCILLH